MPPVELGAHLLNLNGFNQCFGLFENMKTDFKSFDIQDVVQGTI